MTTVGTEDTKTKRRRRKSCLARRMRILMVGHPLPFAAATLALDVALVVGILVYRSGWESLPSTLSHIASVGDWNLDRPTGTEFRMNDAAFAGVMLAFVSVYFAVQLLSIQRTNSRQRTRRTILAWTVLAIGLLPLAMVMPSLNATYLMANHLRAGSRHEASTGRPLDAIAEYRRVVLETPAERPARTGRAPSSKSR